MKGSAAPRGYKKVLLGYDGSKNAKRALDRAVALATEGGGSLRVVVAVNTVMIVYGPEAPYYPPDYAEQVTKGGQGLLDEAVALAKQAGVEATGAVEDGHPAEVILRTSESQGTDLVVIGRRGISAARRFLMGGVSSSVVNHSKCDVLIVR